MNKKAILSVLLVIALCGIAAYYLFAHRLYSSQTVSSAPTTQPSASSTVPVCIPVDVFDNAKNISGLSFVDTSTRATVSFGKVVINDGSALGAVDAYVNNKRVGEVQTGFESLFAFSPDDKYFGFRTQYQYGASGFGDQLRIVNLSANTMTVVQPPQIEARNYPKSKFNPQISDTSTLSPRIESFIWDGDGINVTFYFVVSGEYNPKTNKLPYCRVSPKEIWRYDLTTKQYSLLRILPD